jgi:hypothetical protein
MPSGEEAFHLLPGKHTGGIPPNLLHASFCYFKLFGAVQEGRFRQGRDVLYLVNPVNKILIRARETYLA